MLIAVTEGLTFVTTAAMLGSGGALFWVGGSVQPGLVGAVGCGGGLGVGAEGEGSVSGTSVQLKEQPADRIRVRIIARETNKELIFTRFIITIL